MKWEQFRGMGILHPVQTTPVVDSASLIQVLKEKIAKAKKAVSK